MILSARSIPVHAPSTDPDRPLSLRELEAIEERARSVGHASCIHLPTLRAVACEDIPALLAEVRRLRALARAAG